MGVGKIWLLMDGCRLKLWVWVYNPGHAPRVVSYDRNIILSVD
jgi:hypothetical protein